MDGEDDVRWVNVANGEHHGGDSVVDVVARVQINVDHALEVVHLSLENGDRDQNDWGAETAFHRRQIDNLEAEQGDVGDVHGVRISHAHTTRDAVNCVFVADKGMLGKVPERFDDEGESVGIRR